MENGETVIVMLCHVIIRLRYRSRKCTLSWTSNDEEEYTEVMEKYRRRHRTMRSVPLQHRFQNKQKADFTLLRLHRSINKKHINKGVMDAEREAFRSGTQEVAL